MIKKVPHKTKFENKIPDFIVSQYLKDLKKVEKRYGNRK
jgi:hypothetical protein